MKVKLLKDVYQGGAIKTSIRVNRKQVNGWFKDTILEVSDATGEKLIAAGDAEAVKAEKVKA